MIDRRAGRPACPINFRLRHNFGSRVVGRSTASATESSFIAARRRRGGRVGGSPDPGRGHVRARGSRTDRRARRVRRLSESVIHARCVKNSPTWPVGGVGGRHVHHAAPIMCAPYTLRRRPLPSALLVDTDFNIYSASGAARNVNWGAPLPCPSLSSPFPLPSPF